MARCVSCGLTDEQIAASTYDDGPYDDETTDEGGGGIWGGPVESDVAPGRPLAMVFRERPMRALSLPGYAGLGLCWACMARWEAFRSLERALLSDDPEDLVGVLQEPCYEPVRTWLSEAAADRRRRRNEARALLDAEPKPAGAPTWNRSGRKAKRIGDLTPEETFRICDEVRRLRDERHLSFPQIRAQFTINGLCRSVNQFATYYRWRVQGLVEPPQGTD
jgi:hypothetical protein